MKRMVMVLGIGVALLASSGVAALRAQQGNAPLSAATKQALVAALNKGAAFLKQKQRADGLWENHPGINAMVATALLHQPGPKQLDVAGKALDALAKLAKPDGGI